MKQRSFIFLLAVLIIISAVTPALAEPGQVYRGFPVVNTVVNGQNVGGDVPAVIIDGRTMVPLRVITEALGGNIRWDAATHTVYMDIPGATPNPPALPAPDGKTIKIGLLTSASGELSTYGDVVLKAFRMALEHSNNKAGAYKIEFITADDRNDPQEARAMAIKLITSDKVSALVGPLTSKCAIPVSEVASQYKIPMITPTATNEKVTVNNSAHKDYIYRACIVDPYQGTAAAKFALENLKLKTAVVLYDKGNDYSLELAEKFRDYFTKNSGQVLLNEGYQSSDTDFSALLDKVADLKPDFIYLPDYYIKAGDIVKQAKARDVQAVFIGCDGWDSDSLDKAALEGSYFTNHFSLDDPRPEVQQWVSGYKNKFGADPDTIAALSYDATKILLQALANANSADPAKINEALMNIKDLSTVCGKVSFDTNGDPVKPVTIIKIKDGKFSYYAQVTP